VAFVYEHRKGTVQNFLTRRRVQATFHAVVTVLVSMVVLVVGHCMWCASQGKVSSPCNRARRGEGFSSDDSWGPCGALWQRGPDVSTEAEIRISTRLARKRRWE